VTIVVNQSSKIFGSLGSLVLATCLLPSILLAQPPSRESVVRDAQRSVVKIYGAGGLSGLEAYQSGFLVSPEGHIATVWSSVLDVDPIVVLDDGRRFEAKIVGFEPKLELAVLKIEETELPFFRMNDNSTVDLTIPVMAVSNLFSIAAGNEPASVMQGYIAGQSVLDARRGTFKSTYNGPIYVLDIVTSNPGNAGGALIDFQGRLLGMIGKELRDERTSVWLNHAIPTEMLRTPIADIVAGRAVTPDPAMDKKLPPDQAASLEKLGLVLVPNVLEKTPAYVDSVQKDSPAATAGLLPDDLILLINGARMDSQRAVLDMLQTIDARDPVTVTLQRERQVLVLTLKRAK
jgi:S1-C subfamily serine protease